MLWQKLQQDTVSAVFDIGNILDNERSVEMEMFLLVKNIALRQ